MDLNNLFNQSRFDQYAAYLKSTNLSDASIQRKLSSLSSFKKFLVKKKYISSVETFCETSLFNSNNVSPVLKPSLFSKIKSKIKLPPAVNKLGSNFLFRYIVIFSLFAIGTGLGFTLYRQAILQSQQNLAYSTASAMITGGRFLSFQGRLTDSSGNPITSSTNIVFRLYNTGTMGAGTTLYTSQIGNSQTVIPDANGIFSVTIGKSHGTTIPSSVFSENAEVWLEITAGGETMSPRQQIATVGYALNSETLQGLPPSASGTKNTVLVIDSLGNINLGETSPTIKSTSGTLGIEGQAVLIKATDGSGGNITINPDANGQIKLITEGTGVSDGFINATNANLTSGNLFNASINNTNRAYNFINFSNYNIGTTLLSSRFSVDAYGNTFIGGTLSPANISIGNTLLTSSASELNLLDGTLATSGSIIYGNGTRLANTGVGTSGQILMSNGSGTPAWINSVSYSANNGLSLSGNTFKLGGTLSQNTDIGFSGFSLTFSDGGSTFASFSSAGNTFYNPTSFLSGGDVSLAYDLNFTNSLGSNINTAGPFSINAGELFNSSNLTLKTYNSGKIILDSSNVNVGGTLTLPQGASNGYILTSDSSGNSYWAPNSGVGVTYAAGSGLTLSSNIFKLGGALTENTNLTVGGTSAFFIGSTNGNVGIGITNPTQKLQVAGNILGRDLLTESGYAFRSLGALYLDSSSGNSIFLRPGSATAVTILNGGNVGIGYGDPGTAKLAVNGNVGIGTTNPTSKLHVIGNGNITGNLTIGGSLVSVGSQNLVTNLNADLLDGYHASNFINIGQTGAFIYSAGNGLSLSSNTFKLGGTLSQNTNIGFSGFSLTFSDGGSTFASFSSAGNTFYNPTSFLSSGDVSIAYDLNFTNSTASYIRSQAPLYIQTESPYANLDLNFTAANAGQIYLNSNAQLTKNLTIGGTFVSVGSTNLVTNLNADYLDGLHAADIVNIGQTGAFIYSAGNGLSLSGNTFKLGGALTENTNLTIGGTSVFFINGTTGNIGIATTNPLYALTVGTTAYINNLLAKNLNVASYGAFTSKVDYPIGFGAFSIATGDLNGDGYPDLATATGNGASSVSVFINNGNGTFATKVDYATGNTPRSVAVGDLNGDNYPDLSVVNSGASSVSVFINNGNGTFASKVDYTTASNPWSVSTGDLNGDSKNDLAVTNSGASSVSVFINNGNGTFATKVDYVTGTTPRTASIGDLNGDGKNDLAVPNNGSSSVSVFINNGNGTFATKVDYTTGSNPISTSVGDLNGDSKVDLIVANLGSSNISVFINNGNGTFAPKVNYVTGANPRSVAIGDLNGDRYPDLAVANASSASVSVLINNGFGTFAPKNDYPVNANLWSVVASDLNSDGKTDLAVANANGSLSAVSVLLNQSKSLISTDGDVVKLTNTSDIAFTNNISLTSGSNDYLNSSGGLGTGGVKRLTVDGNLTNINNIQAKSLNIDSNFSLTNYTTGSTPRSIVASDFNNDGKTDLAVANQNSSSVSVFINNTFGIFNPQSSLVTSSNPIAISAGNLNGDSYPDLVATNTNSSSVSVFINNGNGTFASKVDYTTGSTPYSVAINDLNNDGKADLAVTNNGSSSVSVFINNGNGTFASKVDYTTGSSPNSVSASDLNSDGKADLAVANTGSVSVSVFINNGDGTFATKVDYTTGASPNSVSASDLNSDGKADLAVANQSSSSVSIFTNNGDGTFATKVDYATGSNPYSIAINDLNNDGKADLAVANNGSSSVSIFTNNGDGTFATKVDYITGANPYSVTIGDFNSDNKNDLAITNGTSTLSILMNKITTSLFTSYGNVGIGTTNPQAKLQIVGDTDYSASINIFSIGESQTSTNTFDIGGTGQNWKADDNQYGYTLPFTFPFFGVGISSVYVSNNGFICLSPSCTPSTQTLSTTTYKVISILGADLVTNGIGQSDEDIYIDSSTANQVTFRWRGQRFGVPYVNNIVNFSATLFSTGKIVFKYGVGNSGINPVIGISNGDQFNYKNLSVSGAPILDNINDIVIETTSSSVIGNPLSTLFSVNTPTKNLISTLNNGNVGIGTTAPSKTLDVAGDIKLTGQLFVGTGFTGSVGQVLVSTGIGLSWADLSSGGSSQWTTSGNNIYFQGIGSSLNGNVGIGTTNPQTKLHILANAGSGDPAAIIASPDFVSLRLDRGSVSSDALIRFATAGSDEWLVGTGRAGDNTNFSFYKDGVNRLTISGSNGNVGIGTTNPLYTLSIGSSIGATLNGNLMAQKFLDIGNTLYGFIPANTQPDKNSLSLTSTGSLRFNYNDSTNSHIFSGAASRIQNFNNGLLLGVSSSTTGTVSGWNNNLFLNTSGNVGIGTTDPTSKLHIYTNATNSYTGALIENASDQANAGTQIALKNFSKTAYIRLNSGSDTQVYGRYSDLVLVNTTTSGGIKFLTNGLDRMAILNGGNVGIGTTDPTSKLHIYQSGIGTTGYLVTINNDQNDANYKGLYVRTNYSSSAGVIAQFSDWGGDRLTIKSGGNVGIGTTNPIYGKLQITQSVDGDFFGGLGVVDSTLAHGTYLFADSTKSYLYSGNGTGALILNTTGNVGIGTTSPIAKLHVYESGTIATVITNPVYSTGTTTFNPTSSGYSGSYITFKAPGNGTYTIEAWGAQGSNSSAGYNGGKGAYIKGTVALNIGETLQILVGQQGQPSVSNNYGGNGGGGGTFIAKGTSYATATPLIVAGGGGGAGGSSSYGGTGYDAVLTTTGGYGMIDGSLSSAGGASGNGGTVQSYGGGGAGFTGNGGASGNVYGGNSFINGGIGGNFDSWGGGDGGFGGGGGGGLTAGGGGGYSGGGASGTWGNTPPAGGGGSYNAGSNQTNTAGVQTGAGLAKITWVADTGVTTTSIASMPKTAAIFEGKVGIGTTNPLAGLHINIGSDVVAVGTTVYAVGSTSFSPTSTGQTGTIRTWTVPNTGTYTIDAYGAQGGNGMNTGGLGARIKGDVYLTAGTQLKILVGQQGLGNTYEAGGGGGTFITNSSNTPYIVAGGGGGGSNNSAGVNATTSTSGTLGSGSGSGTAGSSGSGGSGSYGASGSGLTGDGGNSTWGNPPSGGLSFVNGGTGGAGVTAGVIGGFGGGGGAHGNSYVAGGGGGGYSGGSGGLSSGYGGGGGGSYNAGTNQTNTAGARTGSGLVSISWSFDTGTTTTSFTGTPRTAAIFEGAVGIGTTNPKQLFTLAGTNGGYAGMYINSAVPASTDYTLYNNNGTLMWNGLAIGTSGSSVSGTTNYLPKFTTSTSLGNSILYESSGRIGINNINPGYTLDVGGTINAGTIFQNGVPITGGAGSQWTTNGTKIGFTGTYVGIGTTNPTSALQVIGDGTFSGNLFTANGSAGAPAFTFTSDTNTGMYLAAADSLSFATAGVQRLNLASNTFNYYNSSGTTQLSIGSNAFNYYNAGGTSLLSVDSYGLTSSVPKLPTNTWTSNIAQVPFSQTNGGASVSTNDDYIYSLYGANYYLYRYSQSTNSWAQMANFPTDYGTVSYASLTYTGGDYLYAFMYLSNGYSFIYRYTISTNSWTQTNYLNSSLGINISYGVSTAYDGLDSIYFMPGGTSSSFYRYSISGNSWTSISGSPYAQYYGTTLAYANGDYIYATFGNSNVFYKYSINSNTWSALTAPPSTPHYGASFAYPGGNYLYFTLGGNNANFYRYNIATNSWTTLASAPGIIYTGGGIVYAGQGYIYAVAGNGQGFYRYYGASEVGFKTMTDGANITGNVAISGNLSVAGGTTLAATNITSNLTVAGNTILGDAATDTTTLRGTVTLTDSSSTYPLRFGTDTQLYRGTADRLDLASGDSFNIVSGNLTVAGNTVVNSSGQIVTATSTTLGDAATDTTTIRGAVTLTDSSSSYPLNFGADTQLYRGTTNRLDLASGDSLNLVSGDIQIAGTTVINSSRIHLAANGSAGAPAFTFTSDTNTGMYLAAADSLSFATAGVQRLNLASNTFNYYNSSGTTQLSIGSNAFNYYNAGGTSLLSVDSYGLTSSVPKLPTNTWTSNIAQVPFSQTNGGASVSTNDDYIYSLYGANYYLYRYSQSTNSWAQMANFPTDYGTVSYASLTYTGGDYLYAFMYLSNGYSFIYRYTISTNSWTQTNYLNSSLGINISYGVSTAYDGLDSIYFMPGGTSSSFYRYSISGNSWTSISGSPYAQYYGTTLAYANGDYIYATFGNSNVFYKYSINSNTWSALTAPPSTPHYGASFAYPGGNYLYFTLGGNNANFYRYNIATNSWTTLASAPGIIYTGGGIVYAGQGYIYAVAGNGQGFYRYYGASDQKFGLAADSARIIGNLSVTGYTYLAGSVGIGTANPQSLFHVAEPYSKTDTTVRWGSIVLSSTDSSNPFGLNAALLGSATDANRAIILQTGQAGLSSAGTLSLQTFGGNVGIGTTTPGSYKLNINGTGYLNAASWTYGSDRRLKENIEYYSDSSINALDIINQLKPASFDYITGSKDEDGFIAQDIQEVLPNLVTVNENGMLGIKTTNLIPYLVRGIQEQQSQIDSLSDGLSITSAGQVNIDYNISDEVLASLGYTGAKNEIESATYSLNDSFGNTVSRISQFNKIISAKIQTGLLSATNVVTKNMVAEKIVSPKANIDHLTALDIQATSIETNTLVSNDIQSTSIDTENLTAKDATVSTLYADNIISKEGSIGDLMTAKVSALRDELKKLVDNKPATSSAITGTSILSQSSAWSMNIASDSAKITGDLELTNNLIVGAKLAVSGDTQLGNAFISGTFTAGEIAIQDNYLETANTALYIQPSNTGSVHIMGDTLVIAENGNVEITGNLKVSGSLMASLITADEIQANKLTATEINSKEIKVATDSAQIIIAESGFGAIATSSAKLTSNATAGTATLPAGKTEIVITNNKLTANSMVYLTPVGSTNNQVPYIKTKMVYSEAELLADPSLQNYFTIALDNYLDKNIDINWWIIN